MRFVVQAFCTCGEHKGKPRWRDAQEENGRIISYKRRSRAEAVARDLQLVWEPDKFRVVERKE